MNIFPAPSKCEKKEGAFTFSENDTLFLIIDSGVKNADFRNKCSELWSNFTAGKAHLEVVEKNGIPCRAAIAKSRDCFPEDESTEYEYVIRCTENAVNIAYSCENGLFHAFSTLLQIISPYSNANGSFSVPCCEISDRPVLKLRGIHLCVFPETSLLFLRKAVRLCGLLKYSHVILEFWGMYRYSFMKELGWSDGYTAAELRSVIEDGRALGIEFIPMFNHLGHASQSRFKAGKNVLLDNAPEYEEYFEPGGWTWKVSKPEVKELLRSVRSELCGLFGKGEYFHVGCDEAYICDGLDKGLDEKQNREFTDFLNETAADIESHGRKMIMWGDMFLDKNAFPFPYCSNICFRCTDTVSNLERLNPGIIVADWQYNVGADKDDTVKYFAEHRRADTLILSPWEGYENVSAADNIKGRCTLAKKHGLLGVVATTWNTVNRDTRNLIYAACEMWSENEGYADLRTWEVYKCIGMQNLRKLMPSGGDREKAGWFEGENTVAYV